MKGGRFMRCALLVLVVLFAGGCNLFSPFHDEGKSDSLDDIVGDVQAALERGEPDKAFRYAEAGIEKYPESLALHYLGAVAKVQSSDIGFVDFAAIFRSDGDDDMEPFAAPFGGAGSAEGDTTFFFDVSPAELAEMAETFGVSFGLLEPALAIIEGGHATEMDLVDFRDDALLGAGISAVLTAMLTVLDADHDLSNGFELNPLVRAFETDDGWGFSANVSAGVVCDEMPIFRIAEEALYDHYRYVVGGDLPPDIPAVYEETRVEDWVSPRIDDGALTGEIFSSVHDGLVNFRERYGCDLEGGGR
jgi:hypothetical protein